MATMQINGNSLGSNYELIRYQISQPDKSNKVENNSPSYNPYSVEDELNVGSIQVELNVYGSTDTELQKNIGILIMKLQRATIKFSDVSFKYDIAYDKKSEEEPFEDILSNKWCENITFNFYILSTYDTEVTVEFNNALSCNFTNLGTKPSPVLLEITPSVDYDKIEISGLSEEKIVINNLIANKTVYVNGYLETVTCDGANKYGDTDMWEFPKAKSGSNTVTASINTCSINIKYKPQY